MEGRREALSERRSFTRCQSFGGRVAAALNLGAGILGSWLPLHLQRGWRGGEQPANQDHGNRDTAPGEPMVWNLPLPGCVTSDKLCNLSVPHFLIGEMGRNGSYLSGCEN